MERINYHKHISMLAHSLLVAIFPYLPQTTATAIRKNSGTVCSDRVLGSLSPLWSELFLKLTRQCWLQVLSRQMSLFFLLLISSLPESKGPWITEGRCILLFLVSFSFVWVSTKVRKEQRFCGKLNVMFLILS